MGIKVLRSKSREIRFGSVTDFARFFNISDFHCNSKIPIKVISFPTAHSVAFYNNPYLRSNKNLVGTSVDTLVKACLQGGSHPQNYFRILMTRGIPRDVVEGIIDMSIFCLDYLQSLGELKKVPGFTIPAFGTITQSSADIVTNGSVIDIKTYDHEPRFSE